MTEETQEKQEPQFVIQRVYLKDLSLETPMGTAAFFSQKQPQISQDIASEVHKVKDDLYESVLKLTISAKIDEETLFMVEIHQGGLFAIKHLEGQQLSRVMNTIALQVLFPYARETIDSALVKASLPPLMLPSINFDALYTQAMQNQQQEAQASS